MENRVAKLDFTDTEVVLLIATIENATYSGKAARTVGSIQDKLESAQPKPKEE